MDLNRFLRRIELDLDTFKAGSHAEWKYNDPSGESSSRASITWDEEEGMIHAVVSETIEGETSVIYALDMNENGTGISTQGVEEDPGQDALTAFAYVFRENVVQMERVA